MKHSVNSCSLQKLESKYDFLEIFCSDFGAVVAQQIQRDIQKMFWDTLNLFSQHDLLGKKRDQIILILPVTLRDQSKFGKTLPCFCKFELGKQTLGF